MEREERVRHICQWLDEVSSPGGFTGVRTPGPLPPWDQGRPGNSVQQEMHLERIEEALAQAYLAANLRSRNIPLKEFMDDFERRILVSCLRLAQGNQKNVAAVLNVKPTSLFEKLRKHGIRSRQKRPCGLMATTATEEIA